MRGILLSIQVGKPKRMCMPADRVFDGRNPFWTSGIFKEPVEGEVRVSRTEVAGDGQADLDHHGGFDNAVLAYDAGRYPGWREELNFPELRYGAFGENFTVEGFTDDTVCVGDTWAVGPELILQVTQARQPCHKLARRLERPQIVKRVRETGWGGWYLRVLQEGRAKAGMTVERVGRVHPEWPVAAAVQVMYARRMLPEKARELAGVAELSQRWKEELVEEL